jgi:hypothetical protein
VCEGIVASLPAGTLMMTNDDGESPVGQIDCGFMLVWVTRPVSFVKTLEITGESSAGAIS